MTRAVLSIGANLGDAAVTVRGVMAALGERLVAASPLYRTAPWGGVEQDDFINATVIADDPLCGPADWLRFCREQEAAADRVREVRWGPRTLDVDVIAVRDGDRDVTSSDPELILPHPRAQLRAFVLVPWLAVEPAAELPGYGAIAALVAGLPAADVAEVVAL